MAAKDKYRKYNINPEFEILTKVPVAKTKFQVRLVQMLFGRLAEKQASTEEVEITRHEVPSPSSPKGSLTVLEYSPRGIEIGKDTAKKTQSMVYRSNAHMTHTAHTGSEKAEKVAAKAVLSYHKASDGEGGRDEGDGMPCVLFLHGGAFLFPALPYHYRLAYAMALKAHCKVFFPLHDLGPKYRPPIQTQEALDVYEHLVERAKDYCIDPTKIALLGDSSGGTMAAALALLIRDKGLQRNAGQMLLYPSVDSRKDSKSMEMFSDVPVINGDAIQAYTRMLKVDRSGGDPYYISPAEAENLANLPETYIETAEFDALRDEGVAFARRLSEEGNVVILNETKGTVHAYDMAGDTSILATAMEERLRFLRRIFAMRPGHAPAFRPDGMP